VAASAAETGRRPTATPFRPGTDTRRTRAEAGLDVTGVLAADKQAPTRYETEWQQRERHRQAVDEARTGRALRSQGVAWGPEESRWSREVDEAAAKKVVRGAAGTTARDIGIGAAFLKADHQR
jgi:hypothetical protein